MRRWSISLAVVGGILLFTSGILWMRTWRSAPRDGKPSSVILPRASQEAHVPDFQRALEQLDALLDAVEEGDWIRARSHFQEFEQLMRALPSPGLKHPDVSVALIDFFHLYRVQLERALADEDVAGAIFACNQLGDIVWDLRRQLGRAPLPELGRLWYLGRDLQYWSEVGDEKMIRLRLLGLAKVWGDVRPIVSTSTGRELVAQFDELLDHLHAARAIEEYREITPELEEIVRQIEAHLSSEGTAR